MPADQWQEVLSSARAHHAAGTLFRTKDTVVTVEADEEDVSLLEEEGEEEGKDDDNQEEFPAPSVQAAPEPAKQTTAFNERRVFEVGTSQR